MSHKMSLKFATITCARCASERLLTQACTECGLRPRPHETQPDLIRRRKLLSEAKRPSILKTDGVTKNFDEACQEIPGLIDNVRRALAYVSRPTTRSSSSLVEAFSELDARVAVWSQRQPRPATNRGRSLGRSLELVRRGLSTFADALGQPTLLAAQVKESEGQHFIDVAARELAILREIGEAEQRLSSNGFGGIGSAARLLAGEDASLEVLDEQLQRIAGREAGNRPVGLGLNLNLFRQIMLLLLDFDECNEVARFAETNMGSLHSICLDPGWQARHGVVTAQFSAVTFNLSRIGPKVEDLEVARNLLQVVMQCRDGIIRHCLATLLAEDAKAYHDNWRHGSGFVIKKSSSQLPQLRLNENLSQELRHAAAHFDYDMDGQSFIFEMNGMIDKLPFDEFLDQVLGYLQTGVSLLVALLCTTAVQGLDLELSKHTPERDILAAIEMLIGFAGFADVSAAREGRTLQVTCAGQVEHFSTAAAGIGAIVPISFERVRALVTDASDTGRVWEGVVADYRDYLARDTSLSEIDDLLALARLMSEVRIDSQPAWNTDAWAGVAITAFNQTESWPLVNRIRVLRELRELALKNKETVISETLASILETLRQGPRTAAQPASLDLFRRRQSPSH